MMVPFTVIKKLTKNPLPKLPTRQKTRTSMKQQNKPSTPLCITLNDVVPLYCVGDNSEVERFWRCLSRYHCVLLIHKKKLP